MDSTEGQGSGRLQGGGVLLKKENCLVNGRVIQPGQRNRVTPGTEHPEEGEMLSRQLQYGQKDGGPGEGWMKPENRGVLAAEGLKVGGGEGLDFALTQEAIIWDLCPGLS